MLFPTHLKPAEPNTATSLENERRKATFSPNEMETFVFGKKKLETREKLLKMMRAEPEIFGMENFYHLSRVEKLDHCFKQELRLVQLLRRHTSILLFKNIEGTITKEDIMAFSGSFGPQGPYDLTRGMFIPTLEKQGTEEQKEVFLKPALDYRIIGCYAQTEMGHGSNIRSLETTATFVEETDEFEINSPTLTSTKWWIGSLGISSTHACVIAQLIVKGKNYGIFPFVVPIRSTVDHKPFPGVTVGDIGPKFGFNTMDNGFLSLDRVRIPRFNLLQRYITVSRNGAVTRPKNIDPRVTYGTMVEVRAHIASNMGEKLAKAVTVATRYTAVRRQFGEAGKPETPVLDYGIVQYRLIPLLAKAYAMLGMSVEFFEQYIKCTAAIASGDFSLLKEMHAVSCGLKRWSSETAVYGVDTCRHLCGGHGFSQFSGLNEFFTDIYPNIIWEGDNYVLAQQTTKYLVKAANGVSKGEEVEKNDTTNVMRQFANNGASNKGAYSWNNLSSKQVANNNSVLLDILAYRFVCMVNNMTERIHVKGESFEDLLVTSQQVCTAHSEYIVCLYFSRFINRLPSNSPLRPVLDLLFAVSALSFLTRNTGELYSLPESGQITSQLVTDLESEYLEKIKLLRPQA
ncbi:Peroxisomal acyl-coenzyme A oxidase 1, partial [Zancudomyces culisetae]